jgi:hypothetical protein
VYSDKGQQRQVPSPLDRQGQSPLVFRTGARAPAGQDFTPIGYASLQPFHIFIIDVVDPVDTESANLPPATLSPTASSSSILTQRYPP